jgi:hypothetical protein
MPTTPDAGKPSAEDAFAEAYRARFAEFHLAWSVFFVSHLSDLRAHFGDLEDALLLAAFGIGPVAAKRRAARASGDAAAHRLTGVPTDDGRTNAKRLADLTGIPRETVRRKLEAFRRRGWVEQGTDRSWRVAVGTDGRARMALEMEAAHAEFVSRLSRLVTEFDRIRGR